MKIRWRKFPFIKILSLRMWVVLWKQRNDPMYGLFGVFRNQKGRNPNIPARWGIRIWGFEFGDRG